MAVFRYAVELLLVLPERQWYNNRNVRMATDMTLDENMTDREWDLLSYKEKNHQLYLRQVALLDRFLRNGAISQAQHDKSLRDLTEKMGENQ